MPETLRLITATVLAAVLSRARAVCLFIVRLQFVDGTIAGLLSWQAEVDPLLAKLRAQVYFTQQQEQQQV